MKRDALAFFRILPPGAADIGDDVSREDLRGASAGDWSLKDLGADDLSDVPLFGPEYDEPVLLDDREPDTEEGVLRLEMGKVS